MEEHRAERRAVKVAVRIGKEPPHPKEYGDEWASPRDGKIYSLRHAKEDMRK